MTAPDGHIQLRLPLQGEQNWNALQKKPMPVFASHKKKNNNLTDKPNAFLQIVDFFKASLKTESTADH